MIFDFEFHHHICLKYWFPSVVNYIPHPASKKISHHKTKLLTKNPWWVFIKIVWFDKVPVKRQPRHAVCSWVLNLLSQVCRSHQIRLDISLSRHWVEIRR